MFPEFPTGASGRSAYMQPESLLAVLKIDILGPAFGYFSLCDVCLCVYPAAKPVSVHVDVKVISF